jgi:hypothetical protein
MAILITTFLFSCQSNNKNSPTYVKKYSEYTDLEKMNLKGGVIGIDDYHYPCSNNNNCYLFTFYNEGGNIEKTFDSRDDQLILEQNIYLNNRLQNNIRYSYFNIANVNNSIYYFKYDSNFNLQKRTIYDPADRSTYEAMYFYDENGFPKEEIEAESKKLTFWSNGNLDSISAFFNNKLSFKEYYLNGRIVKRLIYSLDGDKINTNDSYTCTYFLDKNGNDIKLVNTYFNGKKDSLFRKIFYKGDDISIYYDKYIELVVKINSIGYNNVGENNSYNDFQEQPQQKEKIMCNRCGGTGQKICERCYGKGETRCYRCNGTGVANDGRKCIYCTGGYERCTGCQGRTRISCDGCASRGYTNY